MKKHRLVMGPQLSSEDLFTVLCQRNAATISNALLVGFLTTLATPNISKRLKESGEVTSQPYERFDRTLKTIFQIITNGYNSTIGRQMIMLMNQRHSTLQIPQEDYLYVLSVYSLNSIDWAEKFLYRDEGLQLAWFKRWMTIGAAMGIKNIPETIAELTAYQKQYEKKHLYYDPVNKQLFNTLLSSYLKKQTLANRILSRIYLIAILDPRYRKTLGLWQIPKLIQAFAQKILAWYFLRAFRRYELVHTLTAESRSQP